MPLGCEILEHTIERTLSADIHVYLNLFQHPVTYNNHLSTRFVEAAVPSLFAKVGGPTGIPVRTEPPSVA